DQHVTARVVNHVRGSPRVHKITVRGGTHQYKLNLVRVLSKEGPGYGVAVASGKGAIVSFVFIQGTMDGRHVHSRVVPGAWWENQIPNSRYHGRRNGSTGNDHPPIDKPRGHFAALPILVRVQLHTGKYTPRRPHIQPCCGTPARQSSLCL